MPASISDLYNGAFILILLVAIYALASPPEEGPVDLNGDGVIDQFELETYIEKQIEKKLKKKADTKTIIRSSVTGAIRGFLMGLILGSFEGACVTAITLGIVNPVLTRLEYHI